MPVNSAATHSGLGCPARALAHVSAFRGVAMGLAVSSGGMPVHGTVWNGGACSLQNCLASTGDFLSQSVGVTYVNEMATLGYSTYRDVLCRAWPTSSSIYTRNGLLLTCSGI